LGCRDAERRASEEFPVAETAAPAVIANKKTDPMPGAIVAAVDHDDGLADADQLAGQSRSHWLARTS
jgi:hypothetical protein